PFAVLRGELELAGRPGRSKEELSAAVASATAETDRLTRLTDDLLLLAKGDEDKLSLQLERTDIAPLLARRAERARSRAAAAGVTCQVSAVPDLRAVVDAGRIRQAVDNLVDNALRFAPPGSQVLISAEVAGPSLVIEVCDAGPGFPPEFLPHAFERFRRPDQGRARSAGAAALGLAIVQAIAVAHGGRSVARDRAYGGAAAGLREGPHFGWKPPAAEAGGPDRLAPRSADRGVRRGQFWPGRTAPALRAGFVPDDVARMSGPPSLGRRRLAWARVPGRSP